MGGRGGPSGATGELRGRRFDGHGARAWDAEREVEPLAATINETLGGQRHQVVYSVTTGNPILGGVRVIGAKVEDLHVTSVLEEELDLGFVKDVAWALKAVAPA